jgi:hypothetical protein
VKYNVVIEPVVPVDPDILAAAHEEAREFGCDPDFDAYIGAANPPGPDADTHYFRYSGGHIHIGANNFNVSEVKFAFEPKRILKFIQLMDIIVGVPMVLIDRDEGNIARRELYGRAGCYRQQSYGVEYRTPSNFWLRAPELAGFTMGLCRLAFAVAYQDLDEHFTKIVDQDAVRFAIDFNDFEVAKELWGILKHNIVNASLGADSMVNKYKRRFTDGTHELLADFPGYVMFEYLVHKGTDELFKSHSYEWSLGGNKPAVNGWFHGMTDKIWGGGYYPEFVEFYKAAKPLDNVAF